MRRVIGWIWPRSQTGQTALVSVATLLAIAIAVAVIVPEWSWKNVGPIKDMAGGIQSALTVFAIVVGGVFALFKLQVFRTFEPHLTITHEVHHRYVGDSYVHIDVTATLRNSSRVAVGLRQAEFSIQQIGPISDEEIEALYEEVFIDGKLSSLQWPTLDYVDIDWEHGDMVVEPEGSNRQTYEFIAPSHVETVLVSTYFYNPVSPRPSGSAEGWGAITVYDIMHE